MLYRIWCSSKWYHSRSIWMGIFQPRKLNSVFLLTFFKRLQLKIRTVKMVENYVCCTEFRCSSKWYHFRSIWMGIFQPRKLRLSIFTHFFHTIAVEDQNCQNDWKLCMLYIIWCSISKWYHFRSIWMGIFQPRIEIDWRFWLTILIDDFWLTIFDWRFLIDDFWLTILIDDFGLTIFDWIFQPRKLNSVFLLTFFKRSQLKIRTVKMIENYVCCTEFHVLSNDTTFDQFEWEFSNLELDWLTIFDWRFWLTIFDWRFLIDDFDWRFSIDDFDWRFWLTIFDWRFWLTIFDWRFLIDDFDWRFSIDDFDWRFWLTIFDWRFWLTILIDDFWLTILIDDFGLTIFDWIFQPRKLNSVLLLTFFKRSQLKIRTVKMVENYVCCTEFDALQNDTTLDQFEWGFSNLESWTQYFYSLFSNDRSWRSELSKWLKIMYVVQNFMFFQMIPL